MNIILQYLTQVPDWAWQIFALLLPGNKIFRFISDKLAQKAVLPPLP